MIHIKVPATTANMGPGFDCIGMAFSLYNHVFIEPSDKPLEIVIKHNDSKEIPTDESNLIYQSILRFYKEMNIKSPVPSMKITQEDFIPTTRGLGSSAACIIAGLMAGNELSNKRISTYELANLAAKIEGHPDNTTPALIGGVIFGVLTESDLQYIRLESENFKRLKFAVMIPDFPLSTEKARGILPETISLKQGVFNASRTALMAAALVTGSFDKLAVAMDDCFHQPYRSKVINNMDDIFKNSMQCGADGVFLSGAGPTIIAATTRDDFVFKMRKYLETLPDKWDIQFIDVDFVGATAEGKFEI